MPLSLLAFLAAGCSGGPKTEDTDTATPGDTSADTADTDTDTEAPEDTGPAEDCSGVTTDPPSWTLLDPPEALISWDVPYSYPGAINGLAGVAYGNGLFVATVANYDEPVFRWITSRDGHTWTLREVALPDGHNSLSLQEVFYQRGKFITSGYSTGGKSWFMTSENGASWTFHEVVPLNGLESLASSDDLTVYVGGNNDLRTSEDLATWTARTAGSGSFSYLDVDYGDGVFIANINGGTANAMRSTDGVNWSLVADLPGSWRLMYGNGVWFADSGYDNSVKTSTDGVTFTTATTSGWPGGLGSTMSFTGGRFLGHNYAGAAVATYASEDGVAWEVFGELPSFTSPDGGSVSNYVMGQACGECTCVTVGQYQDFTRDGEWLVDIYPLIATGKVLSN